MNRISRLGFVLTLRHARIVAAQNAQSGLGSINHGRLRRGVFTSVPDLTQAITTWAEHWNNNSTPFIWKATSEEIITKVIRGRETLNQIKTQTDH
jgi:hypothetical protein